MGELGLLLVAILLVLLMGVIGWLCGRAGGWKGASIVIAVFVLPTAAMTLLGDTYAGHTPGLRNALWLVFVLIPGTGLGLLCALIGWWFHWKSMR